MAASREDILQNIINTLTRENMVLKAKLGVANRQLGMGGVMVYTINGLTVEEFIEEADKLAEFKMEHDRMGEVCVTTNEKGECVLVSRQDPEGKILSTIWAAK